MKTSNKQVTTNSTSRERWPLNRLKPHPKQAGLFEEASDAEIAELAADIKCHGLREPIEILPNGDVISGHQRLRALRLLGKSHAAVIIRHDLEDADDAVIEAEIIRPNLHRRHLHQLDRMRVLVRLTEAERKKPKGSLLKADDVRDRVGKLVGMSGRTVSRYLRVLKTPAEVQRAFRDGHISLVLAERVADLSEQKRQEIARGIRGGKKPAAALAEFLSPRRSQHVKPRDALACFAKSLNLGVRDLRGRTTKLSSQAVAAHEKTLRSARKLIRELLDRIPQQDDQHLG